LTPLLAPALLLRAETGGALRPDALGDPRWSVAERLTVEVEGPGGSVLAADGGLRRGPLDDGLHADLWQLQLSYEGVARGITVGRQHLLGPRGFLQLDGVAARADDGGRWGVQGWAGRLWDAEVWSIPDVVVGGAMLTHRPARAVQLDGGVEARSVDGDLEPRLFAAGSVDSVGGDRLWGTIETSDAALNARLDGTLAATRRIDLGAGLRWEGLAPARGPRTPWELLAPDGYGIGEARATWQRGALSLRAAGGPTWAPDRLGASGQLSAGAIAPSGAGVAAFGRVAGIGHAGLAGGGIEVRPVSALVIDAALYELQPLDGGAGPVWEVRARGASGGPGIGASLDAAVYGDATLRVGVRAGAAVRIGDPSMVGGPHPRVVGGPS
jgi:hypothetical protein